MSTDTQTIRIYCPLCDRGPHPYRLTATVSKVAQYAGNMQATGARERTFTQLFTCPTTSALFQASVTLLETPGYRIKGVQVAGVANGEGDA